MNTQAETQIQAQAVFNSIFGGSAAPSGAVREAQAQAVAYIPAVFRSDPRDTSCERVITLPRDPGFVTTPSLVAPHSDRRSRGRLLCALRAGSGAVVLGIRATAHVVDQYTVAGAQVVVLALVGVGMFAAANTLGADGIAHAVASIGAAATSILSA